VIPLHTRSTTVHVTRRQAERLIAARVARWIPGLAVQALELVPAASDEALAQAL
jgi:hypothetical protein